MICPIHIYLIKTSLKNTFGMVCKTKLNSSSLKYISINFFKNDYMAFFAGYTFYKLCSIFVPVNQY